MKILIMDSHGMELKVLSDFLSDQGFEVDSFDRLRGLTSVTNARKASPRVVILGISGTRRNDRMQVEGAAETYPGVPIILLADRDYCVDARSPHIGSIHAIVRRPLRLEEMEWVLHGLCKSSRTEASQ